MTNKLDDRPGFALSFGERIQQLVKGAGGPTKVARMLGKSRGTIDRWQKGLSPDAFDLLPLAMQNGRSMDWVLTGYQVRPDMKNWGLNEGFPPRADSYEALPGFVRVQPFKPAVFESAGHQVEQLEPSDFAVAHDWLEKRGLRADDVRYAVAGDELMAPAIPKGATVVVDNRETRLRSGIYLVEVGDELLVRRLQMLPGGQAELVADASPNWRFSVSGPSPEKLPLRRVIWFAADL